MNKKEGSITSIFLRVSAVLAPLWAPLFIGYFFAAWESLIDARPPRNLAEGSVAYGSILSLIVGATVFFRALSENQLLKLIALAVYAVVGGFALFFSGWMGMSVAGYGY
ncbi:MAG: hypothetical protein KZQ95_02765 [Candidatus Thiodiazotropha sp. (ex Epidulcina cf. delphinae)]|nr:hypothetical protein [Candidatus Thiodiazotropha sp. (ex Epidulcina cf. delphinae)]